MKILDELYEMIQYSFRFFSPIKYRKKSYFLQIFQSFLPGIVSVGSVLFLEKITFFIQQKNIESLQYLLFYFFLFTIFFEFLIFLTRKWGWVNTLPFTISDIYNTYLVSYIKLDNNAVEKVGTGKLIGIIKDGAYEWAELLSDIIHVGTILITSIVFTFYMVCRIHWILGILFIFLIIIFFFLTFLFNSLLKKFRSERYEFRNAGLRIFVKIIASKIEILQSGKIHSELKLLEKNAGDVSRVSKNMATLRTLNKRSAIVVLTLSIITIFYFSSEKLTSTGFDVSFLVGITGTLILMQKSLTEFISFYVDASKRFVTLEKLWDFFDTTPQITGYEEGNTFTYETGYIELQNLSYAYEGNKNVFENFDLKVRGGNITAFVGPSGGGKSTLVKLIAGYLKANSGEILIDGQKLTETSLKSYYQDVGYLTQEPSVFDGTVRENLMYALGEEILDETHLQQILKLSRCEFIYDLPQGLDTEIGERGVKLSGGQKQRLAIAKIFLKNPKIIILDEPTSALDSQSEKAITQAMHELFKDRTVLVIAHRLQTVKYADEIIVIDSGKIIERGNHEELVKQKGYYAEMLELQSGF